MRKATLFLSFLYVILSSANATITHVLEQQLAAASPDQMIECMILMKEGYSMEQMKRASVQLKIQTFRTIAVQSQEPLMRYIGQHSSDVSECEQFWVMNGMYLKAVPAIIREIAQREDVRAVFDNAMVKVAPLDLKPSPIARGIEWNVTKIEADKCWQEGYTGEGIVVGIIDSGVDHDHPALKDKWAGHWLVAKGLPPSDKPYDDFWHGTHCVGSILGGDGTGPYENDIGVAPGAKYVAAKGLDKGGSGSSSQLIECLEFMADLKDKVNLKVVSNSWGNSGNADLVYFEAFKTLKSIDILPLCANGNAGPGAGTVRSPGDYPNVTGVGATDKNDKIANFSSLGPSPKVPEYENTSLWIRDDWNFIKPNISAPGANVRSCEPNGGFREANGTSMATPHITGVVALLLSKNRNLSADMLYSILVDNTDKVGTEPYPNNTFGWGRVNAFKALQATPTMDQPWVMVVSKQIPEFTPGGTVDIIIGVRNTGGVDALNTTCKLISLDNYLQVTDADHEYGDLKPQQEAVNDNNPYTVKVHELTPQGHSATIGLIIDAKASVDSLDFLDTVTYMVPVGKPLPPVSIFLEDFEKDDFTSNWSVTGNWTRTDKEAHESTHSLFSGTGTGENAYATMKKEIDLTTIKKASLSYAIKADIDNAFFTQLVLEVSRDGGNSWRMVWQSNKSNGQLTIPWTTATADISSYTGGKLLIRTNVNANSFFVKKNDWYFDDIEIKIPYDNAPPYFTNTTLLNNSPQSGPFTIKATITDLSGVKTANLLYRVSEGQWTTVAMELSGNHLYEAEIPQQSDKDQKIDYFFEAADNWQYGKENSGTYPIGADKNEGFHTFICGTTGISDKLQSCVFSLKKVIYNRNQVQIMFTLPAQSRVYASIVNTQGKKVAVPANSLFKEGTHSILLHKNAAPAAGLYILNFTATSENKSYQRIQRFMLLK